MVMVHYCDIFGVDYQTTRFMLNGARLRDTDTPRQVALAQSDVIYASPIPPDKGRVERSAIHYTTLCIRVHKKEDKFLRVRCTAPILHQLRHSFCDEGQHKEGMCFVYNGVKLTQDHTAYRLNMEDGDIIDAFNFSEISSPLSIIYPCITLTVINQINTNTKHQFRINQNSSVDQLLQKYCKLLSVSNHDVYFIHGGRRLRRDRTLEEEHLKDGDKIDAAFILYGG